MTRLVIRILLAFVLADCSVSLAAAQETETPPPFTAAQLRTLSEPIALYPDVLISIILPASTFPDEVIDAALLMQTGAKPEDIQKQTWDESIKRLSHYPGVLKMMFEKLAWTKDLGTAFMNQHHELLQTMQELRSNAQQYGNLESTEQQKVVSEKAPGGDTVIRIEPANPEVVYVPQQTTAVVYQEPVQQQSNDYLVPLATFGIGMAMGAAMNDDDDDHDHYYYGGGGHMWYDDDSYDRFMDQREDRQNWRQDNREDWREYAQDNPEQMQQRQQRRADYRNNPQQQQQLQQRKAELQSNPQKQQQLQQRKNEKQQQLQQRKSNVQKNPEARQQIDQQRSEFASNSQSRSQQRQSGSYAQQRSTSARSSGSWDMQSGSAATAASSRGQYSRSAASSRSAGTSRSAGMSRSGGRSGGGGRGGGGRGRR